MAKQQLNNIDTDIAVIKAGIKNTEKSLSEIKKQFREQMANYVTKLELLNVLNDMRRDIEKSASDDRNHFYEKIDNLSKNIIETRESIDNVEDGLRPVTIDYEERKKNQKQIHWLIITNVVSLLFSVIINLIK